MRDPSLLLVTLAITPVLMIALAGAASLAQQLADPCMDWGERWGPVQAGGGRIAPGAPACEGRSAWTTESRASAIVRAAWLPLAALAAAALGFVGILRRSTWALALCIAVLLAVGFPLTIGITVFLAGVPPLLVAIAARRERLAPTPPTIGVGLVAAAFVLLLVGIALVSARDAPSVTWGFAAVYPAQVGAVAVACLWPRAGTAKWRAQDAQA